jgi:pimeloyl-ACP methyl ester carboxylesterase
MRAPFGARERQYRTRRATLPAQPFAPFSAAGWTDGYSGPEWCLRWPGVGGTQSTTRPPIDAPVLVVNGDLDVNTPAEEGRAAAAQFRNAVLLEAPNTGHTPDAEPSGCVSAIMQRFLRHHQTGDTGCLAQIPPVPVTR